MSKKRRSSRASKKKKAEKSNKEKYVKVCPKCGSANVRVDFSDPLVWEGTNVMYECKSCGHRGTIFPEVMMSEIEDFRKQLKGKRRTWKKDELVDSSTGVFLSATYVFGSMFILGLLLILMGIFMIYRDLRIAFGLVISGCLLLAVLYLFYNQTASDNVYK